jgi:DNA-binding CsgD family transcriptional regulator
MSGAPIWTARIHPPLFRLVLIVLVVACGRRWAMAETRVPEGQRIIHESWTFKEGAPEAVRAFAQTRDGYLWVGAPAGLFRLVLATGVEGHYGLHGMRERATLIGGKLTVWSEVDAGTEVVETIRAVHVGKKTLPPEVSYQVAEHVSDDALTPAEIAVLRLIAAGNANKQIANQLSITEETVKSRAKSILSKLGANDRTHAAVIGLKRGIIEL